MPDELIKDQELYHFVICMLGEDEVIRSFY